MAISIRTMAFQDVKQKKKEKSFSIACGLCFEKQHIWNVAIIMHSNGRDKKKRTRFWS